LPAPERPVRKTVTPGACMTPVSPSRADIRPGA
jgi:hypothetical protein